MNKVYSFSVFSGPRNSSLFDTRAFVKIQTVLPHFCIPANGQFDQQKVINKTVIL